MYKLYYSPGAASLAVHWMLIELGVPFEAILTDIDKKAHKEPAYLKLNPGGVIPTLVVDEKPQAEAAALLLLLAERHPKARLAPEPGSPLRADYLQWMFFLANTLQPAYRLWFYPEEGAGPANAEATKAEARKRIETAWEGIDARFADGRRHLLGDSLSAVDFMATMLARWSRNMPKPAQSWPHVSGYIARMKAMASLKEVHAREGLTEWISQ
ncbi:MAG: glutathione S-transferase [Parvularculaceae bacterium]